MAPTTVPSTDKVAIPAYSKIPGARCVEIIQNINDLSNLRINPPRSINHPKQFDHLQTLVHAFAAFKAELLAEFDEPLRTIATVPVADLATYNETLNTEPVDTDSVNAETANAATVDTETAASEIATSECADSEYITSEYADSEIYDTEPYNEFYDTEFTEFESPDTEFADADFTDAETMSGRPTIPGLATNGLPVQGEGDASATASPARGKAMKEALLAKLRPPPLEHSWEFWHDRQGRESKPAWAQAEEQKQQQSSSDPDSPTDKVNESNEYESRLVKLNVVRDLRMFWETMNHFDMSLLRLRDSVHLFHLGVKPVWEDPRNVKGGAWTFRVPKEKAPQFWKEVAMMAVAGELQSAVDNSAKRNAFIDDICGISYSVRFNSHLISVWNRDAGNQEGIDRVRDAVLNGISDDLQIRENQVYYKRHSEHAGFRFPEGVEPYKQ
ncbi:eukaryotic initiation factor 4e [Diplodia corticola]|uniref:Eukaryotic initiation factor 4e n=1 Tax=Diplodia corticola TaxID=236234 RepID=A0A1J9RFA4_9PEZI|nr:eukaryotic initiation factor 4e [Diplodia corticola]OJD31243.1 eukaryotic initiation factor 4e [Diplodia corticola]